MIAPDNYKAAVAPVQPDLVPQEGTNLLAYVLQDDMHNRLTPRVVDIAYTAFTLAKQANTEDGGSSDWFNDTKPEISRLIAKLRKDLIDEFKPPLPVQEPVAWSTRAADVQEVCAKIEKYGLMIGEVDAGPYIAWMLKSLDALAASLQPVQDHVLINAAQRVVGEFGTSSDGLHDLYQALKRYTTA